MSVLHTNRLILINIPTTLSVLLSSTDIYNKWDNYATIYPKEFKKYLKITIVRNPWNRVVMNYENAKSDINHIDHLICISHTFSELVVILFNSPNKLLHVGWKNQFPYIYNKKKELMVNKVLKCENLNTEFNQLNLNIELPTQLPCLLHKDYYNETTKELITMRYYKDIKLFNYEF